MNILLTDLDGTLFNSDREISDKNLDTLNKLREMGMLRVIATGRSLYSALKALPQDIPIEYLIFSSGAGIMNWSSKEILYNVNMPPKQVDMVKNFLIYNKYDFFIQCPIPDSHFFYYFRSLTNNEDFEQRMKIYQPFAKNSINIVNESVEASQLLAILPENNEHIIPALEKKSLSVKIIRTTSPLDHRSQWIEFFHKSVSKANAAKWLIKKLSLSSSTSIAIGNDFNDEDMLNWADYAYVVENAQSFFRPEPQILQIFLEDQKIEVNLQTGKGIQEIVHKRFLLYDFNFLHLNHAKGWWTWTSDLYAILLVFLAISGMFVLKGKKGLNGRGKWFVVIGIILPVVFLIVYK